MRLFHALGQSLPVVVSNQFFGCLSRRGERLPK
jgi:hypothetical protein